MEGRELKYLYIVTPLLSLISSCDLDSMSSINELNLNIVKRYQPTKNEVSRSKLSKVRVQKGQTDRRERTHYHSRIRTL